MGWNPLRERRERELARLDAFRSARRLLDEDIRDLGERLAGLEDHASGGDPGGVMRAEHQQAVDCHRDARSMRDSAETSEQLHAIETVLNDGRFHLACVLARRGGADLPTRREPCYFNAQHGPAVTDVVWTPQGGAELGIQVCGTDADRLAAGQDPDVRMVRIGDRYVPWYAAGGSIEAIMRQHAQGAGGRTSRTDKHVDTGRMASDLSKAGWIKR